MKHTTSRRRFLAGSIAAATIVDRHVLGAPFVPPSDKTTFAYIGLGTQGLREIGGLLADTRIRVVAVCDPNRDSNDYVDWGKHGIRNLVRRTLGQPGWREGVDGIPGGREVGRQMVDAYYAQQKRAGRSGGCASYADFRELLDKERDVDAVKVMTPDHLHATISIAAMRKGKHVIAHKPLANRLHEGRVVLETARTTGMRSYFCPYSHGDSIRRIKSWIDNGAIGRLREIHNWSNRPVWPQWPSLPTDKPPVPAGLDWDLWLGPSLPRPYHPNYTHAVFRGWYEFGGGALADMGHYSLWPVFTMFDLGAPTSVEAGSSHTCTIVDQVSRPLRNDVSFPAANTVRFEFPQRESRPPVELFWYDGGMKPRVPDELEPRGQGLAREGMMFVGDSGKIIAGFRGENARIIPERKMREYRDAHPTDPAADTSGRRHGNDAWLGAFRGGEPSPGDFLNAGPLTEAVNLAAVAIRAGGRIEYDGETMRVTNRPDVNRYLVREYRDGWKI